jgi:hypothetical protein
MLAGAADELAAAEEEDGEAAAAPPWREGGWLSAEAADEPSAEGPLPSTCSSIMLQNDKNLWERRQKRPKRKMVQSKQPVGQNA